MAIQLGWPILKRREHIKKLLASNAPTFPLRIANKVQDRPKHEVPIDLPRYRAENIRTRALQREYIQKHDLAIDYFKKDPERHEVQKIQHSLLKELVNEQGLFAFFRKNPVQDEPIFLTQDGFVLNGNRRLCAWRELLAKDSKKFKNFKSIEVLVLPRLSEEQLVELEGQLQIQKDIKAPYSWAAEAVAARDLRGHPFDDDKLAEIFGATTTELQTLIEMVDLSEEYLKSRGKPYQYSEIRHAEFAFRQLLKERKRLKNEPGRFDVVKNIAFHIIDDAEDGQKKGGGRKYGQVPAVAKYLDRIVDRLRQKLPATASAGKGLKSKPGLLGAVKANPIYDGLAKVLSSQTKGNMVREEVQDVIQGEQLREQRQKSKNYVLDKITSANQALQEAIAGFTPQKEKDGLRKQLSSITDAIAELRKKLR